MNTDAGSSGGGFRVSLGADLNIDVGETVNGVDISAVLTDIARLRDHERAVDILEAEEAEVHTLRLYALSALARERSLPGVRDLESAWRAREELWGPESARARHECTQARCQPLSLHPGYTYQDPVTGQQCQALGYLHVCKLTGAVHVCTRDRCTATRADASTQGQYMCQITGTTYGRALMSEGHYTLHDTDVDTTTMPTFSARSASTASLSAPAEPSLSGTTGASTRGPVATAATTLQTAARRRRRGGVPRPRVVLSRAERLVQLHRQARTQQYRAREIIETLIWGAPAVAAHRSAQSRLEQAVRAADRAVARAAGPRGPPPPLVSSVIQWLRATGACVPVPPDPTRTTVSQTIVDRYVRQCIEFWDRLLETPHAQAHPECMNWGNHVLATLYLLRIGRRTADGRQLVPRDDWLASRLPDPGVVQVGDHLGLNCRAFGRGTEAIQCCLASAVAAAADSPSALQALEWRPVL